MPTEIDPSDRLSDGWEPAPLPARTPNDPMPSSPKMPAPSVPPPTLCEQGPCAHYHKAVLRFDAATPMDGSADVTHVQNLRSCYPTPGISIELEDTPVFECSRWAPDVSLEERLTAMRTQYAVSGGGKRYQDELAVWRADQQRIRDELAQFSETPHPELGVIEAMIAEMVTGDALELRRKGKPELLVGLQHSTSGSRTVVAHDVGTTVHLSEAGIADAYGEGDYQLRIVNARGAIVSTRIITITAPQPKEAPNP